MPIDLNATQWVKDCGLEEGLLSQLQKKGVLEGVCGTVVAHDRGETTMVEMVVRKDHGSIISDARQSQMSTGWRKWRVALSCPQGLGWP